MARSIAASKCIEEFVGGIGERIAAQRAQGQPATPCNRHQTCALIMQQRIAAGQVDVLVRLVGRGHATAGDAPVVVVQVGQTAAKGPPAVAARGLDGLQEPLAQRRSSLPDQPAVDVQRLDAMLSASSSRQQNRAIEAAAE